MKKRKRKLKGSVKLVLTLIILSLCAYGGYFTLNNTEFGNKILNKVNSGEDGSIFTPPKDKEPEEVWPKVSKISLVATGDGLLHNPVYIDAYNSSNGTFDFNDQLTYIKDIVSEYDIAYYNQETTFGGKENTPNPDSLGYSSYPTFNTPSEYGDAMVAAGFNMVSLASNHSADCKGNAKNCIVNSYNYWQDKGVVHGGFNPTSENTNNYIIKEVNGITYTMLNYTWNLNGLDTFVANDPYLVNMYDEEKVKADILEVRDKVDVLIVAMHWHTGEEYTFTPTAKNIEIANFLASQDVDIVLGTYSHCLQPFDIIDDTVVFYSLGNFISNQGDLVANIGYKGIVGVLATLDITKTVQKDGTTEVVIDNIGADLTYTYNKNHKNYRVIPFSKMTEEFNSNYLKIYEEYSNVLKAMNDSINIVPVGSKLKEA